MSAFALALLPLLRKALASLGLPPDALRLRVGMHSGPVSACPRHGYRSLRACADLRALSAAAGVLRGDRSRFQVFGDTVNTASRMESTGEPGRIQVSGEVAAALKAAGAPHALRYRGKTEAKGKGQLDTYWLERGATEPPDAEPPPSPPAAPPRGQRIG